MMNYIMYKTQYLNIKNAEDQKRIKSEIGIKIKEFIKENYGNYNKLARLIGFSTAYISYVVSGKRVINNVLRDKLIRDGFDETIFYNYIRHQNENYLIDKNSKQVIYEFKELIDKQNQLLSYYERALAGLRSEIVELKKINNPLINKI